MTSREVTDAVGEAPTLEQRAAELRATVNAPSEKERAAQELARIEQQVCEQQEVAARAAAEKWLRGHASATGSLASQLDKVIARLRENANDADVQEANAIWGKVCERLEWAAVVARRLPGVKTAAAPVVVPPGRRGLPLDGLSIRPPRRTLTPVILASYTVAQQQAEWQRVAAAWLSAHRRALPEELHAVADLPLPEAPAVERPAPRQGYDVSKLPRSEERRVGRECAD